MENKALNREWVKTAAIIFLAVLLVLTFFSKTIMNRTLPEVATAYATSGTITAKVRGTGAVSANGLHEVRADQTREIRSVMVRTGQEVNAGDVLFVLGEGDSQELEEAKEALRQLELSYQRSAIGLPTYDNVGVKRRIEQAKERLKAAEEAKEAAVKALEDNSKIPESQREAFIKAEAELSAAMIELEKAEIVYYDSLIQEPIIKSEEEEAKKELEEACSARDAVLLKENVTPEEIIAAQDAVAAAQLKLDSLSSSDVEKARKDLERCQAEVDACQGKLDAMRKAGGISEAYDKAIEEWLTANEELASLNAELESNNKSLQLSYLDLSDINYQIEKQKEKIKELSGGEENQILASVSGTIQSINCTAGNTAPKDELLCTIEVPDMGYTTSFTVTNDQAKRLRVGDTASVSNFYWGNEILATLTSIKPDPQSPATNKLLSFDLTGDVTTGTELTLSVGQKSATYDIVIPNSAIRSDANGSFVLVVSVKNSPLGNRYIVSRAGVEILASDDINSAVTGGLNNGDYVITTSDIPVKNGDQVRLADS